MIASLKEGLTIYPLVILLVGRSVYHYTLSQIIGIHLIYSPTTPYHFQMRYSISIRGSVHLTVR